MAAFGWNGWPESVEYALSENFFHSFSCMALNIGSCHFEKHIQVKRIYISVRLNGINLLIEGNCSICERCATY